MRVLLPVVGFLLFGCETIGSPIPPLLPSDRAAAEQRAEEAGSQEVAQREARERILVMPGDLSRPYRILGPVRPEYGIQEGACSADALRRAAISKYQHVDAIIGANMSQDLFSGFGIFSEPWSGSSCDGTAVVFIDQQSIEHAVAPPSGVTLPSATRPDHSSP